MSPIPTTPTVTTEAAPAPQTIRDALQNAQQAVTRAESRLDDTIARAHARGATYRDIGGILDISQGTAAARARRSEVDAEPEVAQQSVLDQPL